MSTLTCGLCDQTWNFEHGMELPDDWIHGCQTAAVEVTAQDMEGQVELVTKDLRGRWGSRSYLLGVSPTLSGAKLALSDEEFAIFLAWVSESHQDGS